MMRSLTVGDPPSFLKLLAHELRWRLLKRLAFSDRRVQELVAALDRPQNLVSYHLRQLRDAGLVRERRSSHDARDIYYHLDLEPKGAKTLSTRISRGYVSNPFGLLTKFRLP